MAACAILVVTASLSTLAPALALADDSTPAPDCTLPTGVLETSDLPEGSSVAECEASGRVIESEGGMAVTVPEAGEFTYVEAFRPDGSAETFGIEISSTGTVEYTGDTHEDAPGAPDAADLAEATYDDVVGRVAPAEECGQTKYNLLGFKWYDQTYRYSLGDGPRPAGLTNAEFQSVITDSANNITQAFNNCGRADNVSAAQAYAGTTTHESFVENSAGKLVCRDTDNINVVDAGDLEGTAWEGGAALGIACVKGLVHSGPDQITDVDIRLNTVDYDFTTTPRDASCRAGSSYKTWKFDVESVLTHEFGHGFGLDHVSESTYPKMTMSSATAPCTKSARTLGKGDMLGLESLY